MLKKANEAKVVPVISCDYYVSSLSDTFSFRKIGVYITKSEEGDQYLDSFGGKKSNNVVTEYNTHIGGEDVYVFSDCYVPKEHI